MRKNEFLYKNGQIGSGFTWIGAFVIIFFIIILFAFVSTSLAAKKQVSLSSVFSRTGANEITAVGEEYQAIDFKTSRDLFTFLNSPVEFNGNTTMYAVLQANFKQGNPELLQFTRIDAQNYFDALYNDTCYQVCLAKFVNNKLENIMEVSGKMCSISESVGVTIEEDNCADLLLNAGKREYLQSKFELRDEFAIYLYKKNVGFNNG